MVVVFRRECLAHLAWRRFPVVALVAAAMCSSLRLEGEVLASESPYKNESLDEFCEAESKTPKPDLSTAWTPDKEYYKEDV
mmetsp:Transcript_36551/g.110460  ORF Transcript_36551/g.110460 Transcript_36551/m.110460 type:complete len:81 (+) Transcript_36551:20-262(+)